MPLKIEFDETQPSVMHAGDAEPGDIVLYDEDVFIATDANNGAKAPSVPLRMFIRLCDGESFFIDPNHCVRVVDATLTVHSEEPI